MKKMTAILIVVALLACCFAGCGAQGKPQEAKDVFYIETPYCKLAFPVDLQEYVRVEAKEDDVYSVTYTGLVNGKEDPVFSIFFGGEQGGPLGTLKTGDSEMMLMVEFYDFDTNKYSEEEMNTLSAISINLNTILEYLQKEYKFTYAE